MQGSQFSTGSNYAGNLTAATTITQAVTANCSSTQAPTGGTALGAAILAAAHSQLGVRYSWGAGH